MMDKKMDCRNVCTHTIEAILINNDPLNFCPVEYIFKNIIKYNVLMVDFRV